MTDRGPGGVGAGGGRHQTHRLVPVPSPVPAGGQGSRLAGIMDPRIHYKREYSAVPPTSMLGRLDFSIKLVGDKPGDEDCGPIPGLSMFFI